MENKVIFEMTLSAVIIAIIAVMSYIPYVGYINYGVVSITTIHIVVLVAALLFGWKQGLVAGTAFGLFSFLQALTASTVMDLAFRNPVISILPRVLFGFLAGIIFDGMRKVDNLPVRSILYIVGSVFMTMVHTALVVGMFYAFKSTMGFGEILQSIMGIIIGTNGLIESISAGIVVPLIALPLSRAFPKYNAYDIRKKKEIKN
ncbi:MAG: ECF transporter S component [Bacilli bacterium]|nr:ECF transporter S component [Bacilli bacterium]